MQYLLNLHRNNPTGQSDISGKCSDFLRNGKLNFKSSVYTNFDFLIYLV